MARRKRRFRARAAEDRRQDVVRLRLTVQRGIIDTESGVQQKCTGETHTERPHTSRRPSYASHSMTTVCPRLHTARATRRGARRRPSSEACLWLVVNGDLVRCSSTLADDREARDPTPMQGLMRSPESSGLIPRMCCEIATKFHEAVPVSHEFLASPCRGRPYPRSSARIHRAPAVTSEMSSR